MIWVTKSEGCRFVKSEKSITQYKLQSEKYSKPTPKVSDRRCCFVKENKTMKHKENIFVILKTYIAFMLFC